MVTEKVIPYLSPKILVSCRMQGVGHIGLWQMTAQIPNISGSSFQSIVSITKSLGKDWLKLLVPIKLSVLVFFAKKKKTRSFSTAKSLHTFAAKKWQCFLCTIQLKF